MTRFIISAAFLTFAPVSNAADIVLDGTFDDWGATHALITDPADAPASSMVDFGAVHTASDADHVYLKVDFGRVMNLQRLDGTALLLFDADNDTATGHHRQGLPGVDIIIELSPVDTVRSDRPHMGVRLRSTTYAGSREDPARPALTPYDIGFTFAPTHASSVYELRLDRGIVLPNTPTAFAGTRAKAKFVYVEEDGGISDETETFTIPLTSLESQDLADPLARHPGTDFRVVSWNAEFGAVFQNGAPFSRTLRALDADVVLWQELSDRNDASQLRTFHDNASTNETPWQVLYGAGGGRLRTGIASRLPLQPVEALSMIEYPDWPDHYLRALGGIVTSNGRRTLVVSVHLKCCGRAGSDEDTKRLNEVALIKQAVRQAAKDVAFDAVIIAGDFNLVGAREPLDRMIDAMDVDGSNLVDAAPYQLDGKTNATWADPDEPFVLGRLDYMVYSDSTLRLTGGFVYDSFDLDEDVARMLGVQTTDSASASDHLPLVGDFAWSMPQGE